MQVLLQIVPRLPPSIGGVADYAFLLAQQLRVAHDIHTTFVVCDPNWRGAESQAPSAERLQARNSKLQAPAELDGFRVYQLKERSAAELLRVLSQPGMPTTVLLQYVGYGYERRGCPLWLVRGLDKWRKQKAENRNQNQDSRKQKTEIKNDEGRDTFQLSQFPISALPNLVTMFHELYATGRPWQSSFWTSHLQRWITQTLARSSDHCITNRVASATWLATASQHPVNAISVLPVFSNVGEPKQLPEWNERKPRMIVFGSAGQRRQVYDEHRTELEEACQSMNLEEIVDIGAPFEIPPLSVRVLQRGILSAQEVSGEMLAARAAFFAYPTPYLGKSTIFAAYAAHGLTPVTFPGNRAENEDGLKAGEHYLLANELNGCDAEKIGMHAYRWYQEHGTKKQASCYASRLEL